MQLGVCTGLDNLPLAAEVGFDYLECSISQIAQMSEADFQKLLQKPFPIPILRGNGMIPGHIKLCGPQADEKQWRGYLQTAFQRSKALGLGVMVLGSGAARNVPEGYSYAKALQDLFFFFAVVAEFAEQYNLPVAIEPLRREESNVINSVAEGMWIAAHIDSPYLGVLGDSFHMLSVHEPFEMLENASEKLLHMHISRPLSDLSGREYPYPDDGIHYQPLFDALKKANYTGCVSIEAATKDFAHDAPLAVQRLKPFL